MDKKTFKEKVYDLAEKLRVTPKEVHMRDMNNKWASCSTRGRLTFDYEILELDESLQRYVVVHELIHLRIRNHGKLFKSLLRSHVPGFDKHEEVLKTLAVCRYK